MKQGGHSPPTDTLWSRPGSPRHRHRLPSGARPRGARRAPGERYRAVSAARTRSKGPGGVSSSTAVVEDRDDAPTPPPAVSGESETVVLAVGSGYYHDGRVGPGRYASDLAPTFLTAVTAGHLVLRSLFEEMGAPQGSTIDARCDRWSLRFGAEIGQAQFVEHDTAPGTDADAAGGRGDADEWVRGLVATRDANHGQALAAFEAEAADAVEAGAPQRAAIAYRSAAAAATAAGRADHANRLLRLAGKAYLEIAEKPETIPQGVFMAFREGARCFLEAGNLPLAHTCLSKAIAIGETLGYTAKQ